MGLLQRISTLLKSNINDLISRAEDPEKTLAQAIEDMRKQMAEAKKRVATAIADQKKLERQLERASKDAEEWEKKAMAAVRASRDDLAVEALAKKKQHEAVALQLSHQLADQSAAVDQLKKALTALNEKIEEAMRKRSLLVARAKRAEAQKAIAETLSLAGDRSALESFDRMADKVDRLEAEAEARLEIAALTGGSHSDALSEEIKLLEAHTADDDLLELKKKMGLLTGGEAPKALSPGEGRGDESAEADAGSAAPTPGKSDT